MPVDSFITVFIQCNIGLENKLIIRALLLGLAKSIYYHRVVSLENGNEVILPHVSSTSTCSNNYPKEQVPEYCSCCRGSAKKDGRKFCSQVPNGNKSQCKCYSKIAGCSHRCKCVGCGNPYSSSQAAKQAYTHVTTSRYRPNQKLQEVKESISSLDYLTSQGLTLVSGWSEIESLTLPNCELCIFEGFKHWTFKSAWILLQTSWHFKKSWKFLATKESQANRWETPKHRESS